MEQSRCFAIARALSVSPFFIISMDTFSIICFVTDTFLGIIHPLFILYQLILYADFRNMSRPTFNFRQISIYKYIARKIKNGLQCFCSPFLKKIKFSLSLVLSFFYHLFKAVFGRLIKLGVLYLIGQILLFNPSAVIVRIFVAAHFFFVALVVGISKIQRN